MYGSFDVRRSDVYRHRHIYRAKSPFGRHCRIGFILRSDTIRSHFVPGAQMASVWRLAHWWRTKYACDCQGGWFFTHGKTVGRCVSVRRRNPSRQNSRWSSKISWHVTWKTVVTSQTKTKSVRDVRIKKCLPCLVDFHDSCVSSDPSEDLPCVQVVRRIKIVDD